MTQLPCRPRF